MTTFPDGLYQYGGEPVGGARYTSPWATTWFVDAENGSDSAYYGNKPTAAKATIQAAVTAAKRGDVVYVRPRIMTSDASDVTRYDEQVTIAYAKDSLSIIGVTPLRGVNFGPKIRYGNVSAHTGNTFEVNAAGVYLANLCIHMSTTGAGMTGSIGFNTNETGDAYSTAAGSCGFTVENCMTRYGPILVVGGYDGIVHGHTFAFSTSTRYAGYAFTSNVRPSRGHKILNSHFQANNGAAPTLTYVHIHAGGNKDFLMKNCDFDIVPADNHFVWAGTACTGLVAKCYFAHAGVSTGTNDTDDELYSADGGVLFAGCWDKGGCLGD